MADARAGLAKIKETRMIVKEVRDNAEAEYEYYSRRVAHAQSRITDIERRIENILDNMRNRSLS